MPIPKGEPIGKEMERFIPKGEVIEYTPEQEVEEVPEGKLKGSVEAVTSSVREAAAAPVSGIFGLYELGRGAVTGSEDPLSDAVGAMEAVSDAVAGEGPQTPAGKAIKENITRSPRLKALMEQARGAGEKTLETTKSPAAATAVQTAIEFLPTMFGAQTRFGVKPRRVADREESEIAPARNKEETERTYQFPMENKVRKEDLKRFNKILTDEGIDVSSKQGLFKSLQEIGENVQKRGFGESARKVRDAVLHRKKVEKRYERMLWRRARKGGEAFIGKQQVKDFRGHLDDVLEPYAIENFPAAQKMLERLDKNIADVPGMSAAKLSALHRWRKSVNANMPSDMKSPEAAALKTMTKSFDDFIENQFITDMIKGDPQSVARWRAAIGKSSDIKNRFEADNLIRKFAEHDITAEELRSVLFNSGKVGAKESAQRTIQKLKKILHPDSPEITALRQEALFEVMEPLIKERPEFDAFRERYHNYVKTNPGVVKELFSEKSMEALRVLDSAAKSAEKRRSLVDKYGSLHKALADISAVGLFGHNIAQAGLKVRVAKDVADRMFATGETPAKLEIMRDFLGYDPTQSIFRSPAKRALVIESAAQGMSEEETEQSTPFPEG